MRIAMSVQYDGREFAGWQSQTARRTVQACTEQAISRVANAPVRIFCAGRTDARVHAVNQIIHFDAPVLRSQRSWLLGTNSNLPKDISINWVLEVADDFHARFCALSRTYHYIIDNHRQRSGLWRGKVTWEPKILDAAKSHEAAQSWLGEHDFSAFRAAACQSKSPNRNIHEFAVRRHGQYLIYSVTANAFLQHMVRNFIGVLLEIGRGDRPVSWSQEVLRTYDRRCAGITAPPDGLYLTDVTYPAEFALPETSQQIWPFSR